MSKFDDYRLIKGLDQPDPIVFYDRPDNLVSDKNHIIVEDTETIDLTYFNGVLKADLKDGILSLKDLPPFSFIGNKYQTVNDASPFTLSPNSFVYNDGTSIKSYLKSDFINDLVSESAGNSLRVDSTGKLYVYQSNTGGGTTTGSLQEVTQVGNTTTLPIISAGLRLNTGFSGANSPQLYFGNGNNSYIHEGSTFLKLESIRNSITSGLYINNESQGSSVSLINNSNFIKIISGGSTEKSGIQYHLINNASAGSFGHEFIGNVSFKNNGSPAVGKVPVATDTDGNWIWSDINVSGEYVTLNSDQYDIRGNKTWKNTHIWDFDVVNYKISGSNIVSNDAYGNSAYMDLTSNKSVRQVYNGNTFSIKKGSSASSSLLKFHINDSGIYDTREVSQNTWVALSPVNKEKSRLTRVQDVEAMIADSMALVNSTIDEYDQNSRISVNFPTPVSVWTVDHNLQNPRPNITITDLSGEEFIAKVTYVSNTRVVVNMDSPMSGFIYLTI
jgi:hypothetical protein